MKVVIVDGNSYVKLVEDLISVVELFHQRCPEHMVYISDSLKQKAYLLLERLEQEKHYFSEEWVKND